MTRTYRVETPSGTITRRTDRTYTYVVVTAKDERSKVTALVADWMKTYRIRLAAAERKIAENDFGWDRLPAFIATHYPDWTAEQIAAHIEKDRADDERRTHAEVVSARENLSPAGVAKHTKEAFRTAPARSVLGWCGRYDLALKLSARKSGSMIIAVPQPEEK